MSEEIESIVSELERIWAGDTQFNRRSLGQFDKLDSILSAARHEVERRDPDGESIQLSRFYIGCGLFRDRLRVFREEFETMCMDLGQGE